jgi:glutamate-1-semialdehyde 2,1-aminomutase
VTLPPIDLELRRGAALLGRAPPDLRSSDPALAGRLRDALAARFPRHGPWRLYSSRGEAVAAVLAACRSPERPRIVRFRGCRHLHEDEPEPNPSDDRTWRPAIAVATDLEADDLRLRFNDSATLEAFLDRAGAGVASVLLEPVPLRMSLVVPAPDFLPRVREASARSGAWLIFDEGASGLRFGATGSGPRFGVEADALVFGEALAAGLPLGAAALRSGLEGPGLEETGASGPSPAALAASLECIAAVNGPDFNVRIDSLGARLAVGLELACADLDRPAAIERLGSAVGLVFPRGGPADPAAPGRYDRARYAALVRRLTAEGVRLSPHPMDPIFVSASHTPADIDRALDAFRLALAESST